MTDTAGDKDRSVDYEVALRLIPRLIETGDLDKAERWARQVVSARPSDARAWNQYGLVESRRGRFISAMQVIKIANLLEPGSADLLVNRGNMARMRVHQQSALDLFRKANIVRPGDREIEMAIALQLLTLERYEEGLELYETRRSRHQTLEELEQTGIPTWDGDPESVSSLACVIEQGAGDAIQFVRYAADLERAGIEVVVYCTEPLVRLLATATGVSRAVTRLRAGQVDAAEMMMSLPRRFSTRPDALPAPGRYLEPPAHPYRLPSTDGRPKVGLCWAGNPNHRRDLQRSCPFETMATLLDVDGIDFFSLQVGEGAAAVADEPRIHDLAKYIDDFADTAGLIDQLDLVITIDSAVAHVAGALNKPCWVLLHVVADWRWGQSGSTTGWYPATRLERREFGEDWLEVMPRLSAALESWRDAWSAAPDG